MFKPLSLVAALLLLVQFAFSQTSAYTFALPTVFPNAPNAAGLGRYGEIPVAINTGVPQISIPMTSLTCGKLTVPVSISYHASGIKVMDQAGVAGLGWSLQAGGQIVRVVQGIDDFTTKRGFSEIVYPQKGDPIFDLKELCLAARITDTKYHTDTYDGQPDFFYYNLNGASGKFMYKNRLVKGIDPGFMTVPYQPIKISRNGYEFTIIGTDGNTYIFGNTNYDAAGLDKTQTYGISSGIMSATVVTAFYLQKIISTDKADTINFSYVLKRKSFQTGSESTIKQTIDELDMFKAYYQQSFSSGSEITTHESILTEIISREGKISFDYDLSGENSQLQTVHLFQKQQDGQMLELKKYQLYQSEFQSGSSVKNQRRLDSLKETGMYNGNTVELPAHTFKYFGEAPPFRSKSQDFWGYYNGYNNNIINPNLLLISDPMNGSLIPKAETEKRKGNEYTMNAGTIRSIQYPTGGSTRFEFEPNQKLFDYIQYDTTRSYDYYHIIQGLDYKKSVQFVFPEGVEKVYTGPTAWYNAEIDYKGSKMCDPGTSNCAMNESDMIFEDLTTGTRLIQRSIPELRSSNGEVGFVERLQLVAGHTYKISFVYDVTAGPNQVYRYHLVCAAKFKTITGTTQTPKQKTILTGGLRIKKIISEDSVNNQLIKEYKYPDAYSYWNSYLFQGDFKDLATRVFRFEGFGRGGLDPHDCQIWKTKTYIYSENLPLSLGATTNNSVSYSKVEEYQSDQNGNYLGKTEYNYQTAMDQINMAMPLYRIDREDERARLLNKKIYKNNGTGFKLVQETENQYKELNEDFKEQADTVAFYTAHALLDNEYFRQTSQDPYQYPAYNILSCPAYSRANQYRYDRHFYTSSRNVPSYTRTIDYADNGISISRGTRYNYANPYHLAVTRQTDTGSRGEVIVQDLKYAGDYTYSSCSNNAKTILQQQYDPIKAVYYSKLQLALNRYVAGKAPRLPVCSMADAAEVMAAFTDYNNAQAEFEAATDGASSLLTTYNSNLQNYQNCLNQYYQNAPSSEKGIIDLQKQNLGATLIERKTSNNGILNSTLRNDYKTFSADVTLLSKVNFSTGQRQPEPRLEYLSYYPNSNIREVSKTNDMTVSYIWGYGNRYPIAEAKNAAASDIAYTSFESADKGNWNYAGINSAVANAPTGKQVFPYFSGSITSNALNPNKQYIVSFWSKGQTTITGATLLYSGKTRKEFTLYVYKTNPQVTQVVVQPSGLLDELRLCPLNAQMTTNTFEPMIGLTSSADAKSNITYYEYDGAGRLLRIRDTDSNILKQFSYEYYRK